MRSRNATAPSAAAAPPPPLLAVHQTNTSPPRQIRQGIATNTKGSAYVVYEDVNDAKSACDRLNGFNFQSRYLVVLYHQPEKMSKTNANSAAAAASSSQDLADRAEHLEKLKQEHGVA